jgi:hypothetical protein
LPPALQKPWLVIEKRRATPWRGRKFHIRPFPWGIVTRLGRFSVL